jgi:hypothetical protein
LAIVQIVAVSSILKLPEAAFEQFFTQINLQNLEEISFSQKPNQQNNYLNLFEVFSDADASKLSNSFCTGVRDLGPQDVALINDV